MWHEQVTERGCVNIIRDFGAIGEGGAGKRCTYSNLLLSDDGPFEVGFPEVGPGEIGPGEGQSGRSLFLPPVEGKLA